MRNTGLDEAQAVIKIARRNINNLRYEDETTLMAESEEELKSLLMKVKEESEKVGLKLNIMIMASSPITSWQIDGEAMETVTDLSLQMVTACMTLKDTCLLLGRKVTTNWQPTPVFLPGESQERRSLVGSHLWGCTESDTTEVT